MSIKIHYCGDGYVLISPCGDKDEDSIVADSLTDVTCEDCLAMFQPEEPKKRGRPKKKKDSDEPAES
jgi:hypothetical protein